MNILFIGGDNWCQVIIGSTLARQYSLKLNQLYNLVNIQPSQFNACKTPVTHSQMYHQIAAGYLIWKMFKNVE